MSWDGCIFGSGMEKLCHGVAITGYRVPMFSCGVVILSRGVAMFGRRVVSSSRGVAMFSGGGGHS